MGWPSPKKRDFWSWHRWWTGIASENSRKTSEVPYDFLCIYDWNQFVLYFGVKEPSKRRPKLHSKQGAPFGLYIDKWIMQWWCRESLGPLHAFIPCPPGWSRRQKVQRNFNGRKESNVFFLFPKQNPDKSCINVGRVLKISSWNMTYEFLNGCFNWMIPNLYIGNGCLSKHPFQLWFFGVPGVVLWSSRCQNNIFWANYMAQAPRRVGWSPQIMVLKVRLPSAWKCPKIELSGIFWWGI